MVAITRGLIAVDSKIFPRISVYLSPAVLSSKRESSSCRRSFSSGEEADGLADLSSACCIASAAAARTSG